MTVVELDIVGPEPLRDGEPCSHTGCASHVTHPCEGCGRRRATAREPVILGDRQRLLLWLQIDAKELADTADSLLRGGHKLASKHVAAARDLVHKAAAVIKADGPADVTFTQGGGI